MISSRRRSGSFRRCGPDSGSDLVFPWLFLWHWDLDDIPFGAKQPISHWNLKKRFDPLDQGRQFSTFENWEKSFGTQAWYSALQSSFTLKVQAIWVAFALIVTTRFVDMDVLTATNWKQLWPLGGIFNFSVDFSIKKCQTLVWQFQDKSIPVLRHGRGYLLYFALRLNLWNPTPPEQTFRLSIFGAKFDHFSIEKCFFFVFKPFGMKFRVHFGCVFILFGLPNDLK